ncbi:MAG: aldehyde dehydrogenase family protein [Silvanigrellales bacterium]|nr:aldehyde dehydrogenase family protein [Silvanigrellales bacterium]
MGALRAIIAGKRLESAGETFTSRNPANVTDIVGTYGNASIEDCREACRAARAAQGKWASMPAPVRAEILANFGKLIEKNKESLSRCLSREMGKPLREARGDVQEAIDTCHFFVSEGRRLYGQTIPSEMPDKECFTYRRPIGTFACITAGNFPFAVPSWYFIPALLCGNACVWKPSEDTPRLSEIFTELIHAAGVPEGVFNVVFGEGPKTGAALVALVDEGLIDKVGFTGSTAVGRGIGEICGRNLQVPCLELGGKNPLVVTPSADLDLAAHGITWSAFGTAGQRCTSLGNLIVHTSVKEALLGKVLAQVNALRIGDPFNEKNDYGPLISEKFAAGHARNVETLVKKHHILLTKQNGRVTESNKAALGARFDGDAKNGVYAFPTLVDGVTEADEIYATETFGPLVNVLTYSTFEDALRIANGTGYGLSSAIYTQDILEAYRFRTGIGAGMTSINNSTSGAEAHLPFGGNGKSGNGSRQSGIWVIDAFTKWQAVNWDMSGKLQLAQMDTGYVAPRDYTVVDKA